MSANKRVILLEQANKFFRQGKIDSAIKQYEKVLEIRPEDLEIRRILADLQLKENRKTEAIKHFEWIADYYLKEGFFSKSIAMYKRISRIDTDNEENLFKLADLYTKQGLVIDSRQIYLELADKYKSKNNYTKSLDMYKKILGFDRNNIKMRLLLADSYIKQGLEENAISEYLIASEIMINKKDFKRAENLLSDIFTRLKDYKILEKLTYCYKAQGNDKKAINLLKSIGSELFKHIELLKILGELLFKNNLMDEAEKIYKKIADIDPEEIEIIMKLGKVYLQREDYDKAYGLFFPLVEKNIKDNKYEEAASLLRFIIASNNSYLPALLKLSVIFKSSGKKNNLIALYESLIPIYEKKEMRKELKGVLEELIKLSDSPFTYEEQLSTLEGEKVREEVEKGKGEDEKEKEFISFNLRIVEDAIKISDYTKAIEVLTRTKKAFTNSVETRLKLFDVYQLSNNVKLLVEEGIDLLELYKSKNLDEEYNTLLNKLSTLKPNDERLIELSGNERTNIQFDFDKEEVQQQIYEINSESLEEVGFIEKTGKDSDVFVLSEVEHEPTLDIEPEKEVLKNLSSNMSELDFYINDGYFGDAEKLIEKIKKQYPENKELALRIERLEEAKKKTSKQDMSEITSEEVKKGFEIESSITDESHIVQEHEDSKIDIDVGELEKELGMKSSKDEFSDLDDISFNIEMEKPEETEDIPIIEIDKDQIIQSPSFGPEEGERKEEHELSSSSNFLDIDDVIMVDDSAPKVESPFEEITQQDIFTLESDEEILKQGEFFLDDEVYLKPENCVFEEIESINSWIEEIQKQRTSTIEKNMTEIFEEFRKGVDEKIGEEDYDTRYNLGIAYKEMGLIEEAIHEFLISSKHPLKFFDSAGLLGMCFREKGLYDDALSWFEKAMETPAREEGEYIAVKYELLITYKLKEDYESAKKLANEILKVNKNFRNISELLVEIENRIVN